MEFDVHRNRTDSDESLYGSADELPSETDVSDAGEIEHQNSDNSSLPNENRRVPGGERCLEDVNRQIFKLFAKPYLDRQTDSQDALPDIMENIIAFSVKMLGERVKMYAEKAYDLSKDASVHGTDIQNMLRYYEDSIMQGFRQIDVQVPHQLETPSLYYGSHNTRMQHVIKDCYHVLRRDLMLDRTMLLDQMVQDDLISTTDASSIRKDRRRNERFLRFINGRMSSVAFEQKFLPALKKEHPILEETLRRSLSSQKGIDVPQKCCVCAMKDTVELRYIAEDMLSNNVISVAEAEDMRNDALSHEDKWKQLQGLVKDFIPFLNILKKKYGHVYQRLMADEVNSFQCLCSTRSEVGWTHPDSGDVTDKTSVFTADDAVHAGHGNSLYDRVANRIFPLLAQRFQEYFNTFKESPNFKNAVNQEMSSLSGNSVSNLFSQSPTYPRFTVSPPLPGTPFSIPKEMSTVGYRQPYMPGTFPGNSQQGIPSVQYTMGLPGLPPLMRTQMPPPSTLIYQYSVPPPSRPPTPSQVQYLPIPGPNWSPTVSQTNDPIYVQPVQTAEEKAKPTFETIEEEANEKMDVDLEAASAEMRLQNLGNRLYPKVKDMTSANPGKITGMLLELDNEMIETLIASPDQLRLKVEEAEKILQTHLDKAKTQ